MSCQRGLESLFQSSSSSRLGLGISLSFSISNSCGALSRRVSVLYATISVDKFLPAVRTRSEEFRLSVCIYAAINQPTDDDDDDDTPCITERILRPAKKGEQ